MLLDIIKDDKLPASQETFFTELSAEDHAILMQFTIVDRNKLFLIYRSQLGTQKSDDLFISASSAGAVPFNVENAEVWGVVNINTSSGVQEAQNTSKRSTKTIFNMPIKAEIHQLRISSKIRFSELLAKRLDSLADATEEEYPDQEPISPESLKDFLSFLDQTPELDYPSVVLTYSGNIRASWTKSKNEHFAVEFYGFGDVGYVVFAPDSYYPFKVSRTSGSCSSKILMKVVEPFNVLNWASYPVLS